MKQTRHFHMGLAGAMLASLLLKMPASASDDLHFGVMTHFAQGWDPSWIPLIAQGSISETRDELYWEMMEPEKGKYIFPPQYEKYMSGLKQNNISPLIILSFENKNHDGGATPYTDDGFAAYAHYGREVLRHYGKQIRAVEIWNEYNGTFCKGPATKDRAHTYLQMLKAVYREIKQVRPDVLVVGGDTSGIPLPYWKELLDGGGLAFMDVLSVHPYRYNAPPEGLEADIAALQSLVKEYNNNQPRPIWVTEIGWETKTSSAAGDMAINEITQAKFLVRAYALLFSAGVERVYWYLLRDYQGLSMGLFHDDAERRPKPAYFALATMINQLHGTKFVEREKTPPTLYSLVFARSSGEQVRVLWSLDPIILNVNGAHAAIDIQGNPVDNIRELKLDDSPLFITGPLTGLPRSVEIKEIVLADSVRDFSDRQNNNGWTYGVFAGASPTFISLPSFTTNDWAAAWGGKYPYLSLTATDQHPSTDGAAPITVVRRWESNYDGSVRIAGQFHCGTQGDGVGVSILIDGQRRFRKLLGGGKGRTIVEFFDFAQAVHAGTRIDFAVDPGSSTNIDYDATAVSVTISKESP